MASERRKWHASLAGGAAILLAGCVTQAKPLYYWGDYQPAVYDYFKGDGSASPEEQIARLELTAQQAHSRGDALPPGFNAHLGLLYLKAGRLDQARQAFRTEEAEFPESKPYMDFFLVKLTPKNG